MANIATMRYNAFAFPYNPDTVTIDYDRTVQRLCVPFGLPVLQELEVRPRIIRGEGEWVGERCVSLFAQLEAEFYRGGPGRLICPVAGPLTAYFTALKVVGKAGPLALRFSFTFLEEPTLARPTSAAAWEPSGEDGLPAGFRLPAPNRSGGRRVTVSSAAPWEPSGEDGLPAGFRLPAPNRSGGRGVAVSFG